MHISLILKAKYLKEKVKTKERNKPRSNRGDKASLILWSILKQLLNSYKAKNSLIFFQLLVNTLRPEFQKNIVATEAPN